MSHQLPCINGLYPLQVPTTIGQKNHVTICSYFSYARVLLIIKIVFYLENATKTILSTTASLYWKVYKFNKSNAAA